MSWCEACNIDMRGCTCNPIIWYTPIKEVTRKELEKEYPLKDNYNQHYYVTQDGHAITEPMRAADIVAKFGPIRELEASGFKVVPA